MTLAQDIRGALQGVLETVSGFPPANQRAYDNVLFNASLPRVPWARLTLATTGGQPFALTGADIEAGVFMVNLYYPPNAGSAAIEAMADLVAAAYRTRAPLVLGAARVMISYVRRGPLLPEADAIGAPVVIGWRCLTAS